MYTSRTRDRTLLPALATALAIAGCRQPLPAVAAAPASVAIDAATAPAPALPQSSYARPPDPYVQRGWADERGHTPYGEDTAPWYREPPRTEAPYAPTPSPTQVTTYVFHLFDGFERGNHWAVESAANHAELSISREHVSEGQHALAATYRNFGKDHFELRREVKADLSRARALRLDAYVDEGPLELVLGCRAGLDGGLFLSPRRRLASGWNRDVSFRLSELRSTDATAYGASWRYSGSDVERLMLMFYEQGRTNGTVHLDNIRFDRPAAELDLHAKPVFGEIVASAGAVGELETFELDVAFEAAYQDFFDRSEVDVRATFVSPALRTHEVHGFVHHVDPRTGRPAWRIRFAPDRVGRWRYSVTLTAAGGTVTSARRAFDCQPRSDRPGYVRISPRDPRFFEFGDGTFYYPMGLNVCWASNYGYFLDKLRACGANWVRIWLCPWNLQLEQPSRPGAYDLDVAAALDDLLDTCLQGGIRVQLVLRYHGMHAESWPKNPYNMLNGGPCALPSEFFYDTEAKAQHKRFLDYVVARWGHSTAILAWELWNEVDLAGAYNDDKVLTWHREMAAYLKRIDDGRHLVTTSVSDAARLFGLFELADIDFVPVHFYSRDIEGYIRDTYVRYRALRKPVFVAEFSRGHRPGDDLEDLQGTGIHAGLWLTMTAPFAGNAMPWWWDTYIDRYDLYYHWQALSAFAGGIDRRNRHYELTRSAVRADDATQVSLQGVVCPSQALLWVYDKERIRRPERAGLPLVPADREVHLDGMLGGTFSVEVWDTHEGKVLRQTDVDSVDGTLSFTLPQCERDIAVRIGKRDAAPSAFRW